MMTAEEKKLVEWHLDIPVCRILTGIKIHLRLISISDTQLLCRYFNCSVTELTENFWAMMKRPKNKTITETPLFS